MGDALTFGTWYCIKCGTCLEAPIYSPLTCLVCRAKYEVVKVLKKMHIAHPVTITSKLNVVIPEPIAFTLLSILFIRFTN